MGLFSGIAKGLGGLLGGAGSKIAAGAQAKAFSAQAEAADVNRGFLTKRLGIELLLQGREGGRATGATRAAIGAGGFTGGGSAADILRQSARDIAFDAESIRIQGEAAIEQERLKAKGFRAAAKGAKLAGNIGLVSGVFNAGTSLLGG